MIAIIFTDLKGLLMFSSLFLRSIQTLDVVAMPHFSGDTNRPFVCLDIQTINGKRISNNTMLFEKFNRYIPSIVAKRDDVEFDIKAALGRTQNPVGDSERAHISVLYFVTFSTNPEIREQQIKRAIELAEAEKPVHLKIELNKINLVSAAPALADPDTTIKTDLNYTQVINLGPVRNTMVTFEFDTSSQEILRELSAEILGEPTFPGNTTREGIVQPYHLSMAQAKLDDNIFQSAPTAVSSGTGF